MTTCYVEVCDLNSLVVYFNVKIHDVWERNVTIKSESLIENIRFLGCRIYENE